MPKFSVTFEGYANRKLNWQELIRALNFIIKENQNHNDFLPEPEKVGDFTVDFIRVHRNGLIWGED